MRLFVSVVLALGVLTGCSQSAADDVAAVKVTRVIDGDTVELSNGQRVRFIGIDTPERGCPGYQEAKKNMEDMVLDKRIVLVSDGKQDTDRYGRLLRYVDVGNDDIGLEQIKDGFADARYDSTDGYPKHSREKEYHVFDTEKNIDKSCPSK